MIYILVTLASLAVVASMTSAMNVNMYDLCRTHACPLCLDDDSEPCGIDMFCEVCDAYVESCCNDDEHSAHEVVSGRSVCPGKEALDDHLGEALVEGLKKPFDRTTIHC